MKILLLLLALLPLATPVFAEEPTLRRALTVYTIAAGADVASTGWSLSQPNMRETNPLVNWLAPHHAAMLTTGEAMDLAAIWSAHRLVGRRHPRLFRLSLYALSAVRFGLAANNVRHGLHQRLK